MFEPCYHYELTPKYVLAYSSDVWCPHCGYMMHFGDEVKPGNMIICRACKEKYVIADLQELAQKILTGKDRWVEGRSFPHRGGIESYDAFVKRNLDWWKRTQYLERYRRKQAYQRFMDYANVWHYLDPEAVIAEVGPGPLGGILQKFNIPCSRKIFIDYIMRELISLGLIHWPEEVTYVQAAAESIPLPNDAVHILLSVNTLDHGWDIRAAISECVRVSRHCFLSFDCRGDDPEEVARDDIDHQQKIKFVDVEKFIRSEFSQYAYAITNTLDKTYPVAYIEVNKDAYRFRINTTD